MNNTEKKLFEAVTSNDDKIIAALFTTYNFEPKYFELRFLPALLGIDTNEEAEESLQALDLLQNLEERPISVLMDARANLKSERKFPNYELLPIADSTQHSKLSFLVFDDHIKLFVSSANMTAKGLHQNKECYVELNFEYEDDDWKALADSIEFISSMLKKNGVAECKAFSLLIAKFNELKPAEMKTSNVSFVGVGPEQSSINFATILSDFWAKNPMDGRKKPKIESILVFSPFYETTTNSDKNLLTLIESQCSVLPGQKEEPFFDFYLPTNQGKRMTRFPVEAYKDYDNVAYWTNPNQRDDKEIRFPHLKAYYVTDQDAYSMIMLGSSNFSPSAYGTAQNPNWEANLVYFKPEYAKKDYLLFAPKNDEEIEELESIPEDPDSDYLKDEDYPDPVVAEAVYEKRSLKIRLFQNLEDKHDILLGAESLKKLFSNETAEFVIDELPSSNLVIKVEGEEHQIFPIAIKDGAINDSLKLIPPEMLTKFIEARYRYGESLKISEFIIQQRKEKFTAETNTQTFDTSSLLMYEVREFNHVSSSIYSKVKADCNLPGKVLYHLNSRFGLQECLKTYAEAAKTNQAFIFATFKLFETVNQVLLAFENCQNQESLTHLRYFIDCSEKLINELSGPKNLMTQVELYKKHLLNLKTQILSKAVA
jgi:HKD family nuclease